MEILRTRKNCFRRSSMTVVVVVVAVAVASVAGLV